MYIGIHTYVYVHGGHLDLARSSTYADPVGGELVCICMSLYMCMFNIINMEIYIHIYIISSMYVHIYVYNVSVHKYTYGCGLKLCLDCFAVIRTV